MSTRIKQDSFLAVLFIGTREETYYPNFIARFPHLGAETED
jgi:hypothetical protein